MRSAKLSIVIISLCLTIFVVPDTYALSFTNVGKAEDKITEALNLRKNGLNDEASSRISDAVVLLNDTLAKEPDNHQAQFLLGQCYWMQGSGGKAVDLFRRASAASEYKAKAVAFIKDETELAGNRGDYKRVFRLYEYTVQIDPSEKAGIADRLKSDADGAMNAGKYDMAGVYYRTLLRYEPSANTQAADAFFAAGEQNSDPKTKLHLYRTALQFDPSKRQQVIDAAAELAGGESRESFESELKMFPNEMQNQIFETAWPWKEVYRKTFVGVGDTGGDDKEYNDGGIWTAKSGKDIQTNDRITIIDFDFEIWNNNKWEKHKRGDWIPIQMKEGDHATFRCEKGKKFTVVAQRR